mmetsp:Transcript_36861/g.51192  ORF Transcript_36861/g.51192 Transcript_36861/m.51192 type:complete len:213 (+) Transcript_36861:273-911(+)|eukprot:CAMPEP_0196582312 /NCGR_PEP_ID=MMETSP1081-20130531/38615_1 /TAXON_ID=36882 /ORGANISM="Pyramimonas amylifera, Strain CCMP720" /LENGTH=212 /DNA_ID=CAMNT_0041902839 /DNA_START=273 /DNA_END=911 /DNA_ORIENTATION=+
METYDALPQRVRRIRSNKRQQDASQKISVGEVSPPTSQGKKRGAEERGGEDELVNSQTNEKLQFHPTSTASSNYEYLDHTADIQLHSWGGTLEEAFEGCALAMFNYMTPLSGVSVDETLTRSYTVQAHDMQSLVFAFLDELLFVFSTELLVCREIKVSTIDRSSWTVTAVGQGECFSPATHEQGTEVKAITYSAMQIHERNDRSEIFVIVDI